MSLTAELELDPEDDKRSKEEGGPKTAPIPKVVAAELLGGLGGLPASREESAPKTNPPAVKARGVQRERQKLQAQGQ